MKKIFLLIAITVTIITTAATNEAQKSFATVNKENGLYIFTDCKPNTDYKTLGVLKAKSVSMDLQSFNMTGLSYQELKTDIFKQIASKKNKEKFSDADGIVFYPDEQKAEVIKF